MKTSAVLDTACLIGLERLGLLDPGESEVIALASQLGFRAILDDRKARLLAAQLNIPVTGTVGLLLKGKQAGHMAEIRPCLDQLSSVGFHLAPALRAEALRLAEE